MDERTLNRIADEIIDDMLSEARKPENHLEALAVLRRLREEWRNLQSSLEDHKVRKGVDVVDLRTIVERLPKLADGTPATPGLSIWRTYLGERWEARIVNVGETTIDVQYTNAANHRAKGSVSRLRRPEDWQSA